MYDFEPWFDQHYIDLAVEYVESPERAKLFEEWAEEIYTQENDNSEYTIYGTVKGRKL